MVTESEFMEEQFIETNMFEAFLEDCLRADQTALDSWAPCGPSYPDPMAAAATAREVKPAGSANSLAGRAGPWLEDEAEMINRSPSPLSALPQTHPHTLPNATETINGLGLSEGPSKGAPTLASLRASP